LDRTLFWTTADLESKLLDFNTYLNRHRAHTARLGRPPGDARAADRQAPIVPTGISLPRPVSNTDSCLISQLRFLTPSLDQQRSFADWTAPSQRTPVNRVSQVSATAIKSASSINSPATTLWMYTMHMKRTNLVLDPELLDQATRLLGVKTYSAAVNLALAEVLRLRKIQSIPLFFGQGLWQGDLAEMREDFVPHQKKSRPRGRR